MKESIQAKLERMASQLEEMAAGLRSIAAGSVAANVEPSKGRRRRQYSPDAGEIERLRSLGRDGAERELFALTQKKLGALLRAVGGSSEEAKRSKEHIIQRILYRAFDFSARHALLKGDEEREWITQLCRLHRPPRPALVPVDWHPPSGTPDGEHIDAIVETEDHLTRVAVEVTRCYRGHRASGEAKIEEQLLDRFRKWLRDATVSCLGDNGYRITFTVYLPAPISTLVPRLKDFLGSPQGQEATRTAIEHALRAAEQRQQAVMIGDAGGLPEAALFHHGSQVYVKDIVAADPVEIEYKFEEPAPGGREGQWQTVIPTSFWADTQALIDAIADKREKLVRYRELATASGARALWLLLIVEESSGWDILAALRGDQDERLQAALATQPRFDEVYLLAKGPWLPEGWDLKRDGLQYDGGPIWKLTRIWPISANTPPDPSPPSP